METPDYYHQTFASSAEGESKPGGGDNFLVEDLLDFSNDENGVVTTNDTFLVPPGGGDGNHSPSTTDPDSSTVTTAVDSCNSSGSDNNNNNVTALDPHFCNDLSLPYDDLAELEWLSNFVEESFSSEDLQKLHLISGIKSRLDDNSSVRVDLAPNSVNIHNINNPIFHPETMLVPAKARSKRSRAAPMNWESRLLVLEKPAPARRQRAASSEGEGRKCLHCATDKTPQWRTGPLGPKTLCNACGVRYKSGRLVPEYRPAASPTFVLTKHSNSHRKVLELRRQKEVVQAHQFLHQHHHAGGGGGMVFDMGSSNGEDFLIHQHVGPDFRQLI